MIKTQIFSIVHFQWYDVLLYYSYGKITPLYIIQKWIININNSLCVLDKTALANFFLKLVNESKYSMWRGCRYRTCVKHWNVRKISQV